MALPVREQFKYWGVAAVVFSVVLWFLGDVLLPFVLGGRLPICSIRWPTGWSGPG